jgi:hypothetical protein
MKNALALTSCNYIVDHDDEETCNHGCALPPRSFDVVFPSKTKPTCWTLANLSIVLLFALLTGAGGQPADVQRQFPFTFTRSVPAGPGSPQMQERLYYFPCSVPLSVTRTARNRRYLWDDFSH